ncbi:MAG: hypothetical protein KatS3mg076_3128 [Candidatus Binatia bacterium]|nr:MAG: hypothetical protein KatS3mg076_3128 [Candidatus Binatia bacterium]
MPDAAPGSGAPAFRGAGTGRTGSTALGLAAALATSLAGALVTPAGAGKADVEDVRVEREEGGTYRFSVTVRHADEGWDHYANRWEIVAPDGRVLAVRVLRHPHVEEQPFTRSLSGVKIPEGIDRVTVRAFDSKHGGGGRVQSVEIPRP